MTVQRIGMDLAKQMFQVHGGEHPGKVVLRKQLTRGKIRAFIAHLSPCLIGMEAWARAHYWARAFSQLGPTVRLLAPQVVRPSRKNPKHEGHDAEAICEAGSRPTMRVVPAKAVAQQAV
jgi:transposase